MARYSRTTMIESTACTIETPDGSFCDAPRAPGSPFSICGSHAAQLYRWMHEMVTEVQSDHHKHIEVFAAAVREVGAVRHAKANTAYHLVYYVRVGDLIKIGTTTNLKTRIHAYPPGSELLATERGGHERERMRHRQFRHLLVARNEWFRPERDLMDHITTLATAQVA